MQSKSFGKLKGLLNSEKRIEITLIGLSCALSDRSLLDYIFRHSNVKKINIAYHKDKSEYFKIFYNLSRIVKDPVLL